MIVELTISWLNVLTLTVGILNFVALVAYAHVTYQIAKDRKDPLVSFSLHKIEDEIRHIKFIMTNNSKVNVEVWSKVWVKINDNTFSGGGFYGDESPWVLQPFMQGNGHFKLNNLQNGENTNLNDFIEHNNISTAKVNIQIRYRRVGKQKWKKSSVHTYAYDFEKDMFWLDV